MKGFVASINISGKKGESKTPIEGMLELRPGWGIVGDCHAGTPGRDETLLPCETLGGVSFGGYGENIDTAGIEILNLPKGTILTINARVRIQNAGKGGLCEGACRR